MRLSRIVGIVALSLGAIIWVLVSVFDWIVLGAGRLFVSLIAAGIILALVLDRRERRDWDLRKSEELYHGLFTAMREGVAVHRVLRDADGEVVDYRILDVNRAYERVLDIPRKKAVGGLASEVYGLDEAPLLERYADVVRTGEPARFETYLEPLDQHFRVSAFAIPGDRFVTVFDDITEHKRAVDELRRRTGLLDERVREMRCLYEVARLTGRRDLPPDEVLQGVAYSLSAAWHWPEDASVRIEYGDEVYEAGVSDRPPIARLAAEITVHDEVVGSVEVYYHDDHPEQDEGPFLAEERVLIDTVAARIGQMAEYRRSEAERESLARFPDENPMPVGRVARDGTITHANTPANSLFVSMGATVGGPVPEDWWPEIKAVMESGQARRVETTVGGRTYTVSLAPVVEHGYVNLYATDITARKAAEEALLESERRYRTVFENTGAATCLVDADGTIILANEGFARLAAAPRSEIERSLYFADVIAPHEMERLVGYHEARRTPGAEAPTRYEFDFVTCIGEMRRVLAHVDLIPGTGTSVASILDVTDIRIAQSELRTLTEELEERVRDRTAQLQAANDELEAFAYSVSHDLRAPLRAIDGFSQAVVDDYGEALDDNGRDYLQRVRRASQRMGDLIDDLLQLSRISRANLTRDRVDMSAQAAEIVAALQAQDRERTVEVAIDPDMTVDADRRLLQVALHNLIENAWKFSAGSNPARIEFSSDVDEDGRRIYSIADNGVGFDAEYAGKLFQPFQRLHREDEFPGTGIGLATVRRVIRRHGGDVWAEGEVEEGATFSFTLSEA